MQTLTQPNSLTKPFAESGDKNTIPTTNTDVSNPQRADLTVGFPSITSESPDDGGLPPERKDFNALGYLSTSYNFFNQAGGVFTYDSTIATAIGGYPMNARLWYTDGSGNTFILRSTKQNNTDNFVSTPSYIGTSWVVDVPALSSNNTWTGTNNFQQPTQDTSISTQVDTVGARNTKINSMRSNCIVNIHQDVNFEFASGTLTLKSGSKVYIPNGSTTSTATVPSDVVVHSGTIGSATGWFYIGCNSSGGFGYRCTPAQVYVGNTDPGAGYVIWYDSTSNANYVKYSAGSDGTWVSGYSLPVGCYYRNSGKATRYKAFNVFGCLGTMLFTTPGAELLIPNGKNPDGTLNNTLVSTKQGGTIRTWNSSNNQLFLLQDNGEIKFINRYFESEAMPIDNEYSVWYQPSTNIIRFNAAGSDLTDESDSNWQLGFGIPITYVGTGTNIDLEQFLSHPAFQAIDRNGLQFMWSKAQETTSGTTPSVVVEEGTGYIKYSSGVMIQWGILTETSQFPLITLNKPYVNPDYIGIVSPQAGGGADRAATSIYNYTTTSFQARIQNTSAGEFRWMTIGMWK